MQDIAKSTNFLSNLLIFTLNLLSIYKLSTFHQKPAFIGGFLGLRLFLFRCTIHSYEQQNISWSNKSCFSYIQAILESKNIISNLLNLI